MNQEESILKLLEEGDSAAIRLGHQLLSAANQPQSPMLTLWKQVFEMVEQCEETDTFLEHVPAFRAQGPDGMIQRIDQHWAAEQLDKYPLWRMLEMVRSLYPSGRLRTMSDAVIQSRVQRHTSKAESSERGYDFGPVGVEFKKEWDKAIKAMAQDFETNTP
jgi:hypothetical protein